MTTTPTSTQNPAEHHLEWNDRLQDWLDGDIDPADGDLFATHLRDCVLCKERVEEFSTLETALFAANPAPSLNDSFDARLFAQIGSVNEAQRAAARQRVEQELQENLQALSRSWRRTWAFVIPGMIGGVLLAFALVGSFDAAEVTAKIAGDQFANMGSLQTILTGLMGAALGGFMSGWLAKVAD